MVHNVFRAAALTAVLVAGVSCEGASKAQDSSHEHHGSHSSSDLPWAKDYDEMMGRMHGPMMEGVKAHDPDVAFVKGMIPHHVGAVDMAKIVLKYGKDAEVRKLAEEIIRQQQIEIDQMNAWLAARGEKPAGTADTDR